MLGQGRRRKEEIEKNKWKNRKELMRDMGEEVSQSDWKKLNHIYWMRVD